MLPIRRSMTRFSTSFSNEAEWNSLPAPVVTATFPRFNSISLPARCRDRNGAAGAYRSLCCPLRNLAGERITSILEGAAKFRLHQKANRLRQRIEAHGRDEVLFQAMAEALGYKQNRLPFTLLTQRLLHRLRKQRKDSEALLFGVAGFLDAPDLDAARKSTRTYLRLLWDRWWKYREQFSRLVLPPKIWKTSGARPLNHPHRRLGALAAFVMEWKTVVSLAWGGEAAAIISFLTNLQHDFWSHHYTLAAGNTSSSVALIGESRAR